MHSVIGASHEDFSVRKDEERFASFAVTSKELEKRTNGKWESGRANGLSSSNDRTDGTRAVNQSTQSSNEKVNGEALMELSARREIVELIDVEPTLDYLVLHGVITRNEVTEILEESQPVLQNQRLLELVESRSEVAGVQLLTNVLRLTGQHYLANFLDDGARIKALSGSGYLSKSRHRGQVGIVLRITSMQLPLDPQLKAVSALLGTEWISLENIQTKLSSLKRSQRLSAAHPDSLYIKTADESVAATWPTDEKEDHPSGCCGCCCCCCPRSSVKDSSKKYELSANTNMNSNQGPCTSDRQIIQERHKTDNPGMEKKPLVVTYQPGHGRSASVECVTVGDVPNGQLGSNLNSLRRAADNVQVRCTAIYNEINEIGTAIRAAVQRYFEQDRGILVLNTELLGAGCGVTILCICTLLEHVQKLRKDQSTRLATDLERVIGTAYGTMVHLEVQVDESELDLVELEMNSR